MAFAVLVGVLRGLLSGAVLLNVKNGLRASASAGAVLVGVEFLTTLNVLNEEVVTFSVLDSLSMVFAVGRSIVLHPVSGKFSRLPLFESERVWEVLDEGYCFPSGLPRSVTEFLSISSDLLTVAVDDDFALKKSLILEFPVVSSSSSNLDAIRPSELIGITLWVLQINNSTILDILQFGQMY